MFVLIQAPSTRISGYFWKRRFLSPFSKKSASTRSVFKSFLPVHDIWRHRFRKPPFSSVHTSPKNTRLKNLQSGDRFQKAAVSVTKNTVFVWTEAVSGEKSSVFKNIRIRRYGRGWVAKQAANGEQGSGFHLLRSATLLGLTCTL